MAQRDDGYEISEETRKDIAKRLSEPVALRRMAVVLRSSSDTFTNTLATVLETCADRIETTPKVKVLAGLNETIRDQLAKMAEEIGIVADEKFWEMDFALFVEMRDAARTV